MIAKTLDSPPTRAQVAELFRIYDTAVEEHGPLHLATLPALALRDLCRQILTLQDERDELSDRFDLLTIDHEVTKGYRQHAEQQLAEMREAWNSTAPLTANDLHRINQARARVMKTVRSPPCILCRGLGEVRLGMCAPIKIERCERCNGSGKEPGP